MEAKLEEFLNEGMLYIESRIPTYINRGGCGIFADLLCDNLNKLGISHRIFAVLVPQMPNIFRKGINNYLNTGEEKWLRTSAPVHVYVEIDGRYIDVDGLVYQTPIRSAEFLELSQNQLKAIISGGIWNRTFDKSTIPRIIELMDQVFSAYSTWVPGQFPENLDDLRLTDSTIAQMERIRRIQYGLEDFDYSPYTQEEEDELRAQQGDKKRGATKSTVKRLIEILQ